MTTVPPRTRRRAGTGPDAFARPVGELLLRDDDGPPLLRPADVGGTAAWQALVRDGVLTVLRGDVACVAGTPVGPRLRAGVLHDAVPTGAVVTGRTATWVHTGAGHGDALDLACHPGGRRPPRPPGARLWQAPLLAPDVRVLAGVAVTSPARTAVELALHDPGSAALLRVLADAGADLDAVRRAVLRRPRVRADVRRTAVATVDAAVATRPARSGDDPLPGAPRASSA